MKGRTTRPAIAMCALAEPDAHPGYWEVVQAVGGLPLLLSGSADEAEIDACLERAQAVILDGPPDLTPRQDAATLDLLIRRLLVRRLPFLAIGQGMQRLNAAHGGTLFPPLPQGQPGVLSHSQPRHAVLLESGTRLEELYGRDEIHVSSDHRQAVRHVGTGLRVSAHHQDRGLIDNVYRAVDGIYQSADRGRTCLYPVPA